MRSPIFGSRDSSRILAKSASVRLDELEASSFFLNMIGGNKGGKDGKARFDCHLRIIRVFVNSSHFHFFSRSRDINQVVGENNFLLTRNTTRRNRAGRFLQIDSLKVAILRQGGMQLELDTGTFTKGTSRRGLPTSPPCTRKGPCVPLHDMH